MSGRWKGNVKKKKGYVLDSFAVLSFFQAESGSARVKEILEEALNGNIVARLSSINLGEIFYISARGLGENKAEKILKDIGRLPVKIEGATDKRIMAAARLKAHYPISYADAFAVSLAMEFGASIVTGDPEFKKIEHLIEIDWLLR